jgi:hypothetical protein
MDRESIKLMKKTTKLQLSKWQKIDHFYIVFFLLIIPGMGLFSLFEIFITKTYNGVRTADEIFRTTWPWIIPSIAFYFFQDWRLKFRKVNIEYSKEDFQDAVEKTAKEFDWQIEINNSKIFRAYRPGNWSLSWGEMITIVKDKDRLLLNSICDLNTRASVVSFGWNRKNIDTFLSNLKEAKKRNLMDHY